MKNIMEELIKSRIKNSNNYNSFLKGYDRNQELLDKFVSDIYTFPKRMKLLAENMSDSQLSISAYENEQTLKQFINSSSDFVINSYVQLKLALTEAEPVIRPYYKDRWAVLPDNKAASIDISLNLIEDIHKRLMILLRNLKKDDLDRKYFDPSDNKTYTIKKFLETYMHRCNQYIIKIAEMKVGNIGMVE
jgi:hypothetical protein